MIPVTTSKNPLKAIYWISRLIGIPKLVAPNLGVALEGINPPRGIT